MYFTSSVFYKHDIMIGYLQKIVVVEKLLDSMQSAFIWLYTWVLDNKWNILYIWFEYIGLSPVRVNFTPLSVISARSTFHDKFSTSASNWACWYSNYKCSDWNTCLLHIYIHMSILQIQCTHFNKIVCIHGHVHVWNA